MHRISRIKIHLSPGSQCLLCPHLSEHPFMNSGLRKHWFCAGPHWDPLHSSMGCNCWLQRRCAQADVGIWLPLGLVKLVQQHCACCGQLISKNSNNSKTSEQAWLLSHLASAWKFAVLLATLIELSISCHSAQNPIISSESCLGVFQRSQLVSDFLTCYL